MRRLPSFIKLLLDCIFPPLCLGCARTLGDEEENDGLCIPCRELIPLHSSLFCGVCRARLPEGKQHCHRDAPFRLGAAADYAHPLVRELIWTLKYSRTAAAAPPLSSLLARYLRSIGPLPEDAPLVPIPLNRRRERERGFNQAELIARNLAARTGRPVQSLLIRTKSTKPQAELPEWERRKMNVAGCFAIAPRAEKPLPRRVILIDDVATSLATLTEAARTLKAAGVQSVVGLVAAKA